MQQKKRVTKKVDSIQNPDNPTRMDLASAIRYRREALGYTQSELADAMGIERQRVVQLESAGYLPTVRTLLRVAESLGVSASCLVRDAEKRAK